MPTAPEKEFKDDTRIGEHAAKQPLSGTDLVTKMRFKGFSGTSFVRVDESKKAG